MKCLDCQSNLVRLPTPQGPDLDVCPSGHGLWLDAGEVTCFVENYLALKHAVDSGGGVATHVIVLAVTAAVSLVVAIAGFRRG